MEGPAWPLVRGWPVGEASAEQHQLAAIDARVGALAKPCTLVETHVARIGRGNDVHPIGTGTAHIGSEGFDQIGADATVAELRRQIDVQMRRKLRSSDGEVVKEKEESLILSTQHSALSTFKYP